MLGGALEAAMSEIRRGWQGMGRAVVCGARSPSGLLLLAAVFALVHCTPPAGDSADTQAPGDSGPPEDSGPPGDSGPPDDTAEATAGQVLVSDLRGNGWFVGDLATGEELDAYDMGELEPERCLPDYTTTYCLLFQSNRRRALDGRDEVIFTYSYMDKSDGSDSDREDLLGRYVAVDAETHGVRWTLDRLDFSELEGGEEHCRFESEDPCDPPDSLSDSQYQDCSLYMPHDMQVIDETETTLTLWLADTRNRRLLLVDLDKGTDCGVVRSVVGPSLEDWDIYSSPNSLEYWEDEDGTENLLVCSRDSIEYDAGAEQHAGSNHGKILLWRRESGGEWYQHWEFPAETTEHAAFLNTPHGVERTVLEDGREWILYAHSLGRSDSWEADYGGTVGILSIEDDSPVYVADVVLEGGDAFDFSRDVTALPDGTFLVTDSGCLSGNDCPNDPLVHVLSFDAVEPGSAEGFWTADQAYMHLQEARSVAGPHFGDHRILYSAEWVE